MSKIPPEAFARVSGTIPLPPPDPAGVSRDARAHNEAESRRRFALAQAVKHSEGRPYADATGFIIGMAAKFEQYLKGD